jgi:hypothetical protein
MGVAQVWGTKAPKDGRTPGTLEAHSPPERGPIGRRCLAGQIACGAPRTPAARRELFIEGLVSAFFGEGPLPEGVSSDDKISASLVIDVILKL